MLEKFIPCRGRVCVKRLESRNETEGGLIIPDTAKEKPIQGKVISVGEAPLDAHGNASPLEIKEGDTIVFNKWAGTEIKLGGEDYLIIELKDVMGKIQK